jgi:hypothetical protein
MKFLFFSLLLIIASNVSCQFTKGEFVIGGPGNENGYSMIRDRDNNYLITGCTSSYGYGSYNLYVVKMDTNFNLVWTRTVEGSGIDVGWCIIQTLDKGYAICGYTTSFGAGGSDVYVVKLDSIGNLIWTKTIGGQFNEIAYSIIQTFDSGYAVTGYTSSFGKDSSVGNNAYILKLDQLGKLQWSRTVGGTGGDYEGISILQTHDTGYIICGFTNSFGAGSYDCYIIRVDNNGNLLWTKTIGGPKYDQAYEIIQTKDRGFALCGQENSFGDTVYG